jgi:hypothetical protein
MGEEDKVPEENKDSRNLYKKRRLHFRGEAPGGWWSEVREGRKEPPI